MRYLREIDSLLWLVIIGMILPLGGCISLMTIPPTVLPTPLHSPTPTSPYPWMDASAVVEGICFEAALDAIGKLFVLRSADDLVRFYDLADNSQLCRHPVTRHVFDFSNGRVLAGLWSYGHGCTARHEVLASFRDDAARSFSLQLAFVTQGNCDYELVRALWVSLEGAKDYNIEIAVETVP